MTMIIRILNHLPASGGTLISKSLVAAGTIVLNEVYPFYRRSSDEFSPSGFVDVALSSATQILTKSQIKNALEINFIHQMKAMQKISKLTNVPFFVRPWNYPQWSNDTPVMRDDVCDLIEKTGEDFDISTVVTLRNPIDNFLSFSNNNWSQYQNHPNGFDEFCKRYVSFLNYWIDRNAQIFLYENFCNNPDSVLREIAVKWGIQVNDEWMDKLKEVRLSGDSGRSSTKIALPPRRSVNMKQISDFQLSPYYTQIIARIPEYEEAL